MADTPSQIYIVPNTGGLTYDIDSSSVADGILVYAGGTGTGKVGRVLDGGTYRAAWAGCFGAGDKTTLLQAVFNHSAIKTVIIDTSFTISGTLVIPIGKVIKFENGGNISGTGTINGGIIEAGYRLNIFGSGLTVNPAGSSSEYISVMWFGAVGDASTNDSPAIQRAIDCTVRSRATINTVYFPNAAYSIQAPLLVYYWTGTIYQGFTVKLKGESTKWQGSGQGTRLIKTFKDRFLLGVQGGKGCVIEGIYFSGQFSPPGTSGWDWYKLTLADFFATDPALRISQYSPSCLIAIDPFTNGAVPADGGYPGNDPFGVALTTYYRGTGSSGGSSALTIRDCAFEKDAVGICSSPNGATGNADLTLIDGARFQQIALCISSGQAQEKGCEIKNVGAWSNIHTFFSGSLFGAGAPGQWDIHNVNVAGNLNTFIYYGVGGYFGISISYIFSESMGKFGYLNSTVNNISISNSELGFAYNESQSIPDYHFDLTGVTIRDSRIRYYGQSIPVIFKGTNNYLVNCGFEVIPFIGMGSAGNPPGYTFEGCTSNSSELTKSGGLLTRSFNGVHFAYGQRTVYQSDSYPTHRKGFQYDSEMPYFMYATAGMANRTIAITGASRNYTFTLPLSELYAIKVGDMLFYTSGVNNFSGGVIQAIDSGTGVVTMKWAGVTMVDGTYSFVVQIPILDVGGFIGDVTAGSPNITNVRNDFGIPSGNFNNLVGRWIKNRNFAINYIPFIKVLAWDSGTNTLTLSHNSFYTSSGEYFTNAETKVLNFPTANISIATANQVLQKGMIMQAQINGQLVKYLVIKTGWYNASASPATSDTRFGLYVPIAPYYVTSTPEGNLSFPQGVTVINSTNGDRYLKTSTDNAAINGGNTGWKLLSAITDIVDSFTLVATGSRNVSLGETLYEIHLKPTVNMTIDIGTSAAGYDIQDDIVLPASTTTIVDFKKTADALFTIHFTGVAGGTLNIKMIKKVL